MPVEYFLVATGAAVGATLRWKTSLVAARHNLAPHSVVAINTLGSFILGTILFNWHKEDLFLQKLLYY